MIGIYGGTFDPVHFGHLRPAVDVYTELGLSEIRFIPAGIPAHREQPVASKAQRCQMLLLATENIAGMSVDDREINRDGPSYMIDTIRSLQSDFPDEKFCLIVGMDAFIGFESWREWQAIVGLINIVITYRPNFDIDSITESELKKYIRGAETKNKDEFLTGSFGHCYFCPVTQLDISATRIRELARQGSKLNFLLPDAVVDYLQQERIYQQEKIYG